MRTESAPDLELRFLVFTSAEYRTSSEVLRNIKLYNNEIVFLKFEMVLCLPIISPDGTYRLNENGHLADAC